MFSSTSKKMMPTTTATMPYIATTPKVATMACWTWLFPKCTGMSFEFSHGMPTADSASSANNAKIAPVTA